MECATDRKKKRRHLNCIIHDDFCCYHLPLCACTQTGRYAAMTNQYAENMACRGRVRSSRPPRTVSSTARTFSAPHAWLAWHLGGFVTKSHE